MNHRTAGFAARASVCAAVAVVVPSACSGLSMNSQSIVNYGVSQAVTTVVINDAAGNVDVTGGASAISVSEHQMYNGTPPSSTHVLSNGTLTLTYNCISGNCGIDYTLKVPTGTAVRINDSAGNVTLTGVGGAVEATASAGNITASGLSAGQARFVDSAGNILVGFTAPPASAYADSDAGDVTLLLPGSATYKVTANTQAGDVHVTVPQSNSSANSITAKSAAGDVAVRTQQ